MPTHIANIVRITDNKLIAAVTSDEALQAVGRLFRAEPIMAFSIPFVLAPFTPRKNVIIDDLRGP